MKKLLIILILLFLIVIFSIYALKINIRNNTRIIKNYNREYEAYLNKTIYGAELATLINKVVNQNEINKIPKDENKYYINNEENSIKIEIKMSITEKTYPMEEIYNNDTSEFVRYFDTEQFKCVEINYHNRTGKVSNMVFEETKENK